ncbi:hypothetical protein AALM74_26345 [Parabacteroides segnis]|uniref:hypothetical protein n=1 Tax=Parabacteroides segnis TaxID=2763058 RepID=UPI003511D147
MALTKVLITIKTYPSLSEKYDELVCTAGFLEDGSMIRIYPVPFRKLDYEKQYKKYQWIEMDLEKRSSDFRPESFKPVDIDKAFKVGEFIDPSQWERRRELVLSKVYTDMAELIRKAKEPGDRISLAVLKPKNVLDFIWEPVEREWNQAILQKIKSRALQGDLFGNKGENPFEVVKKLPYKFSYVFTTDDDKQRTLMVGDWELGVLFWNCLKMAKGDEIQACRKVKQKYFDSMQTRDLYFYLGTTLKHHNVAPNPFIVIGVFYPPKIKYKQFTLDF